MLQFKQVKSVLNKHKKRDSWFLDDYSVNPYEGCNCNCLYCYIRGSKYGENMEQGLWVKENVLSILDKQLASRAKKHEFGFVAIGSATDAYLTHEKELELTRGILELMLKHRFPVFISTKRELITRDVELLKQIDKEAILPIDLKDKLNRGVILSVSISSLDQNITDILEPGAIAPGERLNLVSKLKEEGFLTGVNAIPLLPFISDTEEKITEIVNASQVAGADYILAGSLTLFGKAAADSKTLYYRFLEKYDPSLIPKYNLLYQDNFYTGFNYQKQITAKAKKLTGQLGLRNSILKHE